MSASVVYQIRHETIYRYSGDVVYSHQLLYLTPCVLLRQSCSLHHVLVHLSSIYSSIDVDSFGNFVLWLELDRQYQSLNVVVDMSVEVKSVVGMSVQSEVWECVRSQLSYLGRLVSVEWLEAMRFRVELLYVCIKQIFIDYAAECFPVGRSVVECVDQLMHKLHDEMTYVLGEMTVSTSLLEVFDKRRGVCQDYAHLMIVCL